MRDRTAQLLTALAERGERRTMGGHGIRTAADYVAGVLRCAGRSDDALLKRAAETPVYTNPHLGLADSPFCRVPLRKTAGGSRTLMTFENMVTTPLKDRDGDILRSEGAIVDPAMPLLWQHMPPMPIGKMLKVLSQNKKGVKVLTALIDSALGNDAAALIEFGALRISHGFRPLEFDEMKDGGWDIKQFEIMEESLVSVPSNTDAVITAFSRGKLHDPLVKSWAHGIADSRRLSLPGVSIGGENGATAKERQGQL